MYSRIYLLFPSIANRTNQLRPANEIQIEIFAAFVIYLHYTQILHYLLHYYV